ncbi:hypothetical protein [Ferdinandcohnia sp. Marseille-Q9671]
MKRFVSVNAIQQTEVKRWANILREHLEEREKFHALKPVQHTDKKEAEIVTEHGEQNALMLVLREKIGEIQNEKIDNCFVVTYSLLGQLKYMKPLTKFKISNTTT